MSTHHEGNTRFELNRSMAKRCWILRSRTFIDGNPNPLVHTIDIHDHLVDNEVEAMAYGVEKLRPQIAREEAKARGEDISVPADPVIDRLVAREKADREKREAASRKAAEELQAEREADARQLDEANPLWGMF